jgi:hypothetical protein
LNLCSDRSFVQHRRGVCVFVHPLQRVRNRLNKMQISRRPPTRLPAETTGARAPVWAFFLIQQQTGPRCKIKADQREKERNLCDAES